MKYCQQQLYGCQARTVYTWKKSGKKFEAKKAYNHTNEKIHLGNTYWNRWTEFAREWTSESASVLCVHVREKEKGNQIVDCCKSTISSSQTPIRWLPTKLDVKTTTERNRKFQRNSIFSHNAKCANSESHSCSLSPALLRHFSFRVGQKISKILPWI